MAIKIRVDAKKMEDLLRNFYLITGIRIVVFDDNLIILKKLQNIRGIIADIAKSYEKIRMRGHCVRFRI